MLWGAGCGAAGPGAGAAAPSRSICLEYLLVHLVSCSASKQLSSCISSCASPTTLARGPALQGSGKTILGCCWCGAIALIAVCDARIQFLMRGLVAAPVLCLLKQQVVGMWDVAQPQWAYGISASNPDKCDGLDTTIPPDLASAQPRAAPSLLGRFFSPLQQKQNVLFHLH